MRTIEQHKIELYNKIKEIIEEYPHVVIEISTYDGGFIEIDDSDIDYDELDVNIKQIY